MKKHLAFSGYQKFVIAILSFLQFTIILDFMIMSPLGAIMMPTLGMNPSQFGTVVSAYAFSAGISGLLAAGFADRYDRKKLLLFFYVGFVAGTLCCALAPTYHFLLAARIITGLFGGVIGSIVFAITTDLFPLEMRGRVMGFIQTSFAASQVLGIPAGLYFSNLWGWHAPFLMIVGISIAVGFVIFFNLNPIDEHLQHRVDKSPFHHFKATLSNRQYLLAFGATALLSTGGFVLMPFGSAFAVHNMKIDMAHLPMLYLITGLTTIFAGPLAGKASDSFGKMKTFVFGTLMTIVTVLYYTHLGETPLWMAVTVYAVMFVGIFSRMIPSQAIMSAVPSPASRGAFMSVSSSLQQIAGGFAAILAGYIVVEHPDGHIENFDKLGYIVICSSLITLVMMNLIYRSILKSQGLKHERLAD